MCARLLLRQPCMAHAPNRGALVDSRALTCKTSSSTSAKRNHRIRKCTDLCLYLCTSRARQAWLVLQEHTSHHTSVVETHLQAYLVTLRLIACPYELHCKRMWVLRVWQGIDCTSGAHLAAHMVSAQYGAAEHGIAIAMYLPTITEPEQHTARTVKPRARAVSDCAAPKEHFIWQRSLTIACTNAMLCGTHS